MSIVFYPLAPDLGSRLWHWSCSQFSMSSGHEGAGVNRRPEGVSRWESIPAPSGPSPPEFLSHPATPNCSEEAEGSLSCSAHSKAFKVILLTDSFLPHAGSSRVYYYILSKNLVSQH